MSVPLDLCRYSGVEFEALEYILTKKWKKYESWFKDNGFPEITNAVDAAEIMKGAFQVACAKEMHDIRALQQFLKFADPDVVERLTKVQEEKKRGPLARLFGYGSTPDIFKEKDLQQWYKANNERLITSLNKLKMTDPTKYAYINLNACESGADNEDCLMKVYGLCQGDFDRSTEEGRTVSSLCSQFNSKLK